MTRDDIIQMAREAGISDTNSDFQMVSPEGFAALVAAAQRNDLRARIEALERQEPSREWWDNLIADISAIDCVYRGCPSYAHDAYWLREHVVQMFEHRRDAIPSAQPAPSVPDGWKLVPIEPQHETLMDIVGAVAAPLSFREVRTIYDTVLAAPEAKP